MGPARSSHVPMSDGPPAVPAARAGAGQAGRTPEDPAPESSRHGPAPPPAPRSRRLAPTSSEAIPICRQKRQNNTGKKVEIAKTMGGDMPKGGGYRRKDGTWVRANGRGPAAGAGVVATITAGVVTLTIT